MQLLTKQPNGINRTRAPTQIYYKNWGDDHHLKGDHKLKVVACVEWSEEAWTVVSVLTAVVMEQGQHDQQQGIAYNTDSTC